jgi:hypothetical protein
LLTGERAVLRRGTDLSQRFRYVTAAFESDPLRHRLFEGFNDLSSPTDSSPRRIKSPTPLAICMRMGRQHSAFILSVWFRDIE